MDDTPTLAEHPGRLDVAGEEARAVPPLHFSIAQYPDCQQLQLWLPREVPAGWTRLSALAEDGRVLLDAPVASRLSGARHLLVDTLPWPPGRLRVRVAHESGGHWQLTLQKAGDDQPPVLPEPCAEADPQEDLRLREAALADLTRRLLRDLVCRAHGRHLRAHYTEPGLALVFEVEMGRDGRPMALDAPAAPDWEAVTGVPLARRAEILGFVRGRLGLGDG